MAHAQTSEERNSMPTQSTTLLIVDDDGVLLHLLSVIMAHSGFDVRTAQDGFAALAAIRAEIPDILLSDLYMPGMSGFELLSVVRRRFPAIPVIAMSSTYSGPGVPAGVAADAFYEKATDLNALLGIVNEIRVLPDGIFEVTRSSMEPVWLPWQTDSSEDSSLVITCPECMRSFNALLTGPTMIIHEAKCIYCSTVISYAVVGSVNPPCPERLLPGNGAQARIRPAAC